MEYINLFETHAEHEAARASLEDLGMYLSYCKDIDETTLWYPKSYKIRYTTIDGTVFNMLDAETVFGIPYEYTLLSNTYENGVGIMEFAQPIEKLGFEFDVDKGSPTKAYPLFVVISDDGVSLVESPLLSIEILSSVTTIGYMTFAGCTNLTSVTIPNSVTSMGHSAFEGCTRLTSVTIPNSVTSMGTHVFAHCSGLTSVTIPISVTSIENYTFYSCSGLTSINIPNSITSIGDRSFAYCTGLTSVTIPNSVTTIELYAFAYCTGLTSVTYNGTVYTSISALESALRSKGVTVGNNEFAHTGLSD